ncbi:amidohydrolase family protein [Aquimarina brevivitae]|uniref:Imidazolonepropionase-like amidohydrolase n=1 Tax=Aquimarina brevivitae TaxID=323412 RepID=A0A4Q7P0C4_9FLAO|nr:amidohydrolase family protein [Aquimarina brevivitae]RZS93233.1 imidazolonepropionase-like amidohydrolase [Aquimarina brevivitae]
MKHIVIIITLLFFSFGEVAAQQTPADKQTEAISIVGATAHIGDGSVIENSTIVFENGKITAIGTKASTTTKGKVIDASGKHVYPGIIAPNTTLGLVEIGAVRATDDDSEIGLYNPHVRSIIAYNAESKIVESMRPSGVLIAQTTPRGGRISGTSSIVQLDAWNWEDAAMKIDDGIHINWPNPFTRGRWWMGEDPGYKPNKKYTEQITELEDFIKQAKATIQSNEKAYHLPHMAMKGAFDGTQNLYIHVESEKAILDVINFAQKHSLKNIVIVGGDEAYKVTAQLKAANIPVLLTRTHSTPNFEDDDYDQPYKNARILFDSGVLVGLQNSGQMERANARNLPFQAGTVAAHGLDKEKALQLITLNNAKILGIDTMAGTLAVGKDATLFISEGDALDMRTNQLDKAYIQGRDISLESHHTKLWKRYSKKYGK